MRFDLIVCFVNPNITEKVVKTAKSSGATGDVIIQGKGCGIEPSNFLGLSIQDKTDIVLFIVEEHHTNKIIECVSEECNIEDPGNGILIALKIDKVAGLSKQIKTIRDNLKTEQL
ncbi:MAG TPA: P-II family nitrogen regulator [Cyclobacteriaceae bacterium]